MLLAYSNSWQCLLWKGIFLPLWWEQNAFYLLPLRDNTTFSETWVLTCDNGHSQMTSDPWTAVSRAPLKQLYKAHWMWDCSADGLYLIILILSVSDWNQHVPNPKGCDVILVPQSSHIGSGRRGGPMFHLTCSWHESPPCSFYPPIPSES